MLLKKNIEVIVSEITKKAKIYAPIYAACMIFAGIIYAMLMVNQLVNPYDGLWEYSYYTAGRWELSLGRWFWLYLDQMRLGISTDPLTSIISLAIFSLGMIVLLDFFELENRKVGYLICFLFLSNTAVCISLSYRYMSPTFGIAFLLSILAAWIIVKLKNDYFAILFGAVLIALTVGAYQAYIGCECLALLGYIIYASYDKRKTLKDILKLFIRCVVSNLLGGILYFTILNIHLKIFGVVLSAYNGADSYSIGGTISNLFNSIRRTYEAIHMYFFDSVYLSNIFQNYKIYLVAFLIYGLLLCYGMIQIWKVNKIKAILWMIGIIALPIACGAVLLITTSAELSMQMTASMGLLIPLLVGIGAKIDIKNRIGNGLKILSLLITILILYGNVYQVQLDQNAMLEGKIATTTMAEDIINRLGEEDCMSVDLEYCILGLPAGNEMFMASDIFDGANAYAKFGVWWLEPSCTRRSWNGVFSYLCGVNLPICQANTYYEMMDDREVMDMPAYPKDGFIMKKGNIVVVKVADY